MKRFIIIGSDSIVYGECDKLKGTKKIIVSSIDKFVDDLGVDLCPMHFYIFDKKNPVDSWDQKITPAKKMNLRGKLKGRK
jgi:hypothetical protein